MERRIKENLLYVFQEVLGRFWKPIGALYLAAVLFMGALMAFRSIDRYLSSYEVRFEKEIDAHTGVVQALDSQEIREAHIEIQKLRVQAPIIFVESTKPEDFREPLKRGVTHYPSALPGDKGVAIILGHSAPVGWLGGPFDGVFSNLHKLEQGDEIMVVVDGSSHLYRMKEKTFLRSGQDLPEELGTGSVSRLVLLSCWPPGIDNKRIMIEAEHVQQN
ncbi:MAG: sortase [Patescibacteria group bacterium]